MNVRRVPADALTDFVTRAFEAAGVDGPAADDVARTMVEADLLGYDTHGVFRLGQYVDRLRDGGSNAMASPRVVQETAATALIDGDDGLGHLAMNLAVRTAMDKARSAGIGWVGVRRSNHAGPAALYVRPQAAAGMIGIAGAVGSANHMPPWGGTELLLGTNPLAVSAPSGAGAPFLLDMATTVAAMGKIKTLAQRGERMPEGWMIGRDGLPLTDPARRQEGFLMPIGGAKGYGLALAIGLLGGVLNGAALGGTVVNFTSDTSSPTNTGQFVVAIDIAAFIDLQSFTAEADRVFAELRAAPPLPGTDGPRIPGEQREETRARNVADGVPLHPSLVMALNALAEELHVAGLDGMG